MIQKKFLCPDINTALDAVGQIGRILDETKHKCAIATIYEKGLSGSELDSLIGALRDCGHPELLVAGISLTLVAELMPEGTGVLLNLILTDEADIEVVTIPCVPGGEIEAADKFKARLDANAHVRAVELFASNMLLNITRFMESAMAGHEDVHLFGTSTIRNLLQRLSTETEDNTIEVEQIDPSQVMDERIIGSEVLNDGFVAVIFAGRNLKVCGEYALGWNPIGRRMTPELGTNPVRGETVITHINGMPAVDIYREYLGVYPDAYLISNICEFPFVVERDGINICLIPIDCGKDGELYFMMTVKPGERLRFTFASHDEVLGASRRSLEKMDRFGPEALFLTLCGNRINFLKEDAHIEWDGFSSFAPDHALMHGACELYYHKGKGGILNSAHLAIGLREGDAPADKGEIEHPSIESLRHGRTLSLSDRMSVFLSKITTELLDMAQEARDANNAKSAFLSHISHEIRTPINVILGMDEMILQESEETGTLEYAEGIRSSGNNLLGIVNDILDFSKIEVGKMNIVPAEYELFSLINDLYNVVRLRAENQGLTVKLDIDPDIPAVLYGDETRIRQVITNMLTNAVKYTENGSVTLAIRKLEHEGTTDSDNTIAEALCKACPGDLTPEKSVRLKVSVIDTGIGIRPEDMEKLFDEYERFDEKRNRKIEGTGLGLSITTELLELMGSRLDVTSTYGEGSEFSFEIVQGIVNDEPVGDITGRFSQPRTRKHRVRFNAEKAHILVVDDSAINLNVVTSLLKKTKINIDTARSGEEALKLVKAHKYDLILLDHLMPDMDGPETLKRMKELEGNMSAATPVISLTANAMTGAKEDYIRAGFADYLGKPFGPRELEDMLLAYIPSDKIQEL